MHGVPLQQVRQLVQQLPSHRGVHGAPGASKPESLTGSFHCNVNICFVSLSYSCYHLICKCVNLAMNNFLTVQNLSSGGVQGLKGLARDGVNELVVDEQPCVLYFWLDDWLRYSGHGARML